MYYKNIEILDDGKSCFTIGLRKILEEELLIANCDEQTTDTFNLLKFLIDYVVDDNEILKDQETLAYGLWMLKFVKSGGYLEIFELDANFCVWVPGARKATSLLENQRKICLDNKTQSLLPTLDQGIAVSKGLLPGKIIQGIRYPSPKHMSGWYITSDEYNGDIETLDVIKLSQFIPTYFSLSKFLALPPGYVFETDGLKTSVWYERDVSLEYP